MRLVLLAAAGLLTAGFTGSALAAHDGPIEAGYWESTSKVTSPIPSSKTKRECVSGKKINSYLTGPTNPHYTCHYDTRHLENGHATMEGECVDNSGFHSKIKVEGQYTPTSFNLDGHLQVMLGGLTIPVNANIEAHRLSGECPAGSQEPEEKTAEGE